MLSAAEWSPGKTSMEVRHRQPGLWRSAMEIRTSGFSSVHIWACARRSNHSPELECLLTQAEMLQPLRLCHPLSSSRFPMLAPGLQPCSKSLSTGQEAACKEAMFPVLFLSIRSVLNMHVGHVYDCLHVHMCALGQHSYDATTAQKKHAHPWDSSVELPCKPFFGVWSGTGSLTLDLWALCLGRETNKCNAFSEPILVSGSESSRR